MIEKLGLQAFCMEQIQEYGINEITRRALAVINPNNTRSLHVSFDIDALDVSEAPSTGTPGMKANKIDDLSWYSRTTVI